MRSIIGNSKSYLKMLLAAVVICGLLAGTVMAGGISMSVASVLDGIYVQAYNQDNLIRFHVIANSDTPRDQALKRRVRDLIVQEMSPSFSKAKNIAEARKIARTNLAAIEDIAGKEVSAWGEDYKVKAVLGRYSFPTKSYGKFTLPAGEYEAVRVIIGQGAGANWWCVLFPPMCFVDVSKGLGAAEAAAEEEWLADAGSETIFEVEPETRFEVKFKLFELLKSF